MINNLVFGYININVIDGSAIFMSSLCNVLSKNNKSETDLLLAVPQKRNTILEDLEEIKNVSIVDPFFNNTFKDFNLALREQISIEEAANLIIHSDNVKNYDRIYIRSLDVTKKLLELQPSLIHKTFSYITGITSSKQTLSKTDYSYFENIEDLGGKFLCQTSQMKKHILSQLNLNEETIIDLNPMIPDIPFEFEEIFAKKASYNSFVYTGKFASEWNTVPMVTKFRELKETHEASLNIAGDQFKRDLNDSKFVEYAKYLLENTNNVNWYGGLTRKQTLTLIKNADVGLSWRAPSLDDSLELSTKVLEYCSLGKPPIINKTDMHIEIFGDDYPFYCENGQSFINSMQYAIDNPETLEKYSEKVFQISKNYTFSSIALKLAKKLGDSLENYTNKSEKVDMKDYFEDIQTVGINNLNNDLKSGSNTKEYEALKKFTNQLNSKYETTIHQLKTTKEYADMANNKYKITMEKHKKAVSDYNVMKSNNKKLKKQLSDLRQKNKKELEAKDIEINHLKKQILETK